MCRGGILDRNRVTGTIDEVVGVAKQKTADLTGSTQLKVEGIGQQFKGKIEGAWGQAKDAAREANDEKATPPASHD
jgi:uncharacterized protein YjbJ (UPF0337 family)